MTLVHGTADQRFAPVLARVEDQLAAGEELGLSLHVDLDGESVVDVWGGHRDAERTQEWTADTITNVWSITKTVTSLAALMLVDRGDLDVDAPVARYWPEFAHAGKQHVKVRHLLSHSSGVSGLDGPATLGDLYDTRGAAARMAAQRPWWEPGTASGYHVLNYGHLIGELVTRISGRSLKEFVEVEIAGPLGADFRLGVADADLARVSDVVPPDVDFDPTDLPDSPARRTFLGPRFTADAANTAAWRAADLGAANGHSNARGVAAILRVIAGDGVFAAGRLLESSTVDLIFQRQTDGVDLVNGLDLRWGIGFALPKASTLPWIPDGEIAFWGGWGGSMAIADRDRGLTISYVMNQMGSEILGSARAESYVRAVYEVVAGETV
jgi:CubicO group peptidase (beta-lactamase class C family)